MREIDQLTYCAPDKDLGPQDILQYQYGASISVQRQEDHSAVLTSTYNGFTRYLRVTPEHEVRLITNPDLIRKINRNYGGPLLAITEPTKSMSVCDLHFEPKGVSTEKFMAPKNQKADVQIDPEIISAVEERAKEQLDGTGKFEPIRFSEDDVKPDESLSVNGFYYARVTESRIEWISPKATRMRRTDIKDYIRTQGIPEEELPEAIQEATEAIKNSPAIVHKQPKAEVEKKEEKKKPVITPEERKRRTDNARNFISTIGIPHELLGVDAQYLDQLPPADNLIPIQEGLKRPSREGGGMFTKAASREWSFDANDWGCKIRSPFSPDMLAEVMGRAWGKVPLISLADARITKDPKEMSDEERALSIWQLMTHNKIEQKGSNLRDENGDQKNINLIHQAIAEGKPVQVLVFGPWGLAPSPLRGGGRRDPHYGHIDMLTRLSRIDATLTQVYEPGIKFHWVNESDAFIPNIIEGNSDDVFAFEAKMLDHLKKINPDKDILEPYHMGELFWDSDEKRSVWKEFQPRYAQHTRKMFDAYDRGEFVQYENESEETSRSRKWVEDRKQLIYPIATIVNPYRYLPQNTTLDKIAIAYELVRAKVQKKEEEFIQQSPFVDANVRQIGETLYRAARETVIEEYVPTMDQRYFTRDYVSPEFAATYDQVEPWSQMYKGKIHGRITDGGKDRWWLALNSGTSMTHPTHGLAILSSPLDTVRRPSMTIRAAAEIYAEQDRYAAVYMDGDADKTPFHMVQIK